MAINENTQWKNENTLILAASGGGKSQMLNQLPGMPRRGARVLLWDPDGDHRAHHYRTRKEFLAAVRSALHYVKDAPKTRGFRIAYRPTDDKEPVSEFEWFCSVVWTLLDGNYRTFIICEELADPSPGPGAAPPNWAKLMRRCRKYGGRFIGVSQRSQEIPKTCYSQCDIKYIGKHNPGRQAKQVADACGISMYQVPGKDLHFLKLDPSGPPEEMVIQYQQIHRV